MPSAGDVSLRIFNLSGQEVYRHNIATQPAGMHKIKWDGRSSAGTAVASGVYLYQLTAGVNKASKKMVYLK